MTPEDDPTLSMSQGDRDALMKAVNKILDAQKRAKARVRRRQNETKTAGNFVPGPTGRYLRSGGGKISEARPKSYIDWVVYRGRELPGPARYFPKVPHISPGVNISDANSKSELEQIIHRSRMTPGPSAYSPKLLPGASFTTKISDANPKSDVDWIIARSSQIPGPADYNISRCPYNTVRKRRRRRNNNTFRK